MKRYVLIIGLFLILFALVGLSFYFLSDMLDNSNNSTRETKIDPTHDDNINQTPFYVKSQAFENHTKIPAQYCNKGVQGGKNISMPVEWGKLPGGTKSLFLVIVDKHPIANNWLHWVVKDIPITNTSVVEGASTTSADSPNKGQIPTGSTELKNAVGTRGYAGPQPPVGSGDHTYEIHLFALNTDKVDISKDDSLTWESLRTKLSQYKIDEAVYTGYFGR